MHVVGGHGHDSKVEDLLLERLEGLGFGNRGIASGRRLRHELFKDRLIDSQFRCRFAMLFSPFFVCSFIVFRKTVVAAQELGEFFVFWLAVLAAATSS